MAFNFFGKYDKILRPRGKQSGFKDPRILYETESPAEVFVPAGLEAVMLLNHMRALDENQSRTTESTADG